MTYYQDNNKSSSFGVRRAAHANIREQRSLNTRVDYFTKTRDKNLQRIDIEIKSSRQQLNYTKPTNSFNKRTLTKSSSLFTSSTSTTHSKESLRSLVRLSTPSKKHSMISNLSFNTTATGTMTYRRCSAITCNFNKNFNTDTITKESRQRAKSSPTIRLEDSTLKECRYLRRSHSAIQHCALMK